MKDRIFELAEELKDTSIHSSRHSEITKLIAELEETTWIPTSLSNPNPGRYVYSDGVEYPGVFTDLAASRRTARLVRPLGGEKLPLFN